MWTSVGLGNYIRENIKKSAKRIKLLQINAA